MKKYKVKLKHTEKEFIIEADSELEARIKFCKQNNLKYTRLAGKLEITLNNKP